jgi:hypothetical protein
MSEKGERTFRNAVIGGGEMTLWVMNCLAGQGLARQFHPRKQTPTRERLPLN